MKEKVMITKRTLYLLVFSAVLAIVLTLNFVHQSFAKENDGEEDSLSYLKVFTDVVSIVQRNYVTEVKLLFICLCHFPICPPIPLHYKKSAVAARVDCLG